MGPSCHHCLSSNPPCEIMQSEQVPRTTKHLNTSYSHENISYFITTESIMKTKLDILIIFVQRLNSVLGNGFLRELGARDKAKLEERLRMIEGKVQFREDGDYVNIIEPFTSKCEVGNLLIVRMGMYEEKNSLMGKTIEDAFDQANTKCEHFENPTVGLIEADHRLGVSNHQFQTSIMKNISTLFLKNRKGTFVYFTYTEQKLETFISTILNPENSFSKSSFNSSSYF